MTPFKSFLYFVLFVLLTGCATYKAQFSDETTTKTIKSNSKIAHTFYLIGDAGNSTLTNNSPALNFLKKHIENSSKESTLLFLGDNVYETGIPKKKSKNYPLAKRRIEAQTDVAKIFKGNSIFIPGNHDWYNGLDGLKREEKLVEKALGKNSFLPQNGCPLEKVEISKDIVLIIVDTHWYLTNWDKHPTINDNCEIKTRTKFLDEFEGLIKKARGKTTIVALHHPMFTNGSHGGKYSFGSHMSPLPILGSLKNLIRKTSGLTNTDIQNKKYNELKKRIVTLSQENDRTIFVSGHDHNLQYIVEDNLPQIVSGSGSKTTPTKLTGNAKFTYGEQGFAKLNIYKDGSSNVLFYTVKDDKIVYKTEVLEAFEKKQYTTFPQNRISEKTASIYTKEEINKSRFYKFLWGERYRKYFGTEVNALTVDLDTLFGGLKPVRKGGGHQSKSLRLIDNKGREYVMRALRKNAVQYLQAVAFKDQYIEGQFDDTKTENLLNDVFTGSHPYAPFVIGKLSDAVGIYHTNPVLYYIPKQNSLGHFNSEFGDELYMIEERAASGHGDKASFGFANKVISTDDLLENLNKNEKHLLDENAYIKARLFDMLIGDWDRHEDQWRWAVFKEGKQTVYRPIPRDRDQAFSIMGDGFLLNFVTKTIPALKLMQSYKEELKKPKWFNLEPYPLDMVLITNAKKEDWDAQVKHITTNLTDTVIDEAFNDFPTEVNDKTILDIKRKLKGRRSNLQKISDLYFNDINEFQVIRGTQKDDWFDIERLENGETLITGYRLKKGEKSTIFHQKKYTKDYTKEIWIYGLDDKDTFVVKGNGTCQIMIRIIGGQNNDTYNIINGKRVKIYDYKSKKNTFITKNGRKKLTDDYETNVYDYKKLKKNQYMITPSIGFNPDDGIKIGVSNIYTAFGFERNPFSSQHVLDASFYFATKGFELNHSSEFANVFKAWNLGVNATFTSPNFTINYFGLGNNSSNPEAKDLKEEDYNRVKTRKLFAGSYLHWKGDLGAKIKLGVNFQKIEVENISGRYLNNQFSPNSSVFKKNKFINSEASYQFENSDNNVFTTMGMKTFIKVGYTSNLANKNNFGYLIPSISFDHKLVSSGQIVLATKVKSHFTFGDSYEFYQAASIGGNDGLRAYRNQRFTGKNSFYHSSDIRVNIKSVKTGLAPLNIGIYGGFDYGRVWGEQSLTVNPTFTFKNWNTSYGGGVFINAANLLGANLALFNSDDGLRLAISLGFKF
ncbi:metallophosphoesterase [Polaribacter sp. Hel1_85]|uniref:metallophosphoesterase n=1 Tax=Polaribacter sp. Hel1_85 TaxID=1250005 RepID=UPI00052BE479|nr:metallophosphoesterase [Polaribacter sp. Hel1_85]KGL61940.1 calcineurin-like phosphoesterase [Polaribacter sp. Hel1_85]